MLQHSITTTYIFVYKFEYNLLLVEFRRVVCGCKVLTSGAL